MLPHTINRRLVAVASVLGLVATLATPALATAQPAAPEPQQELLAPFACGTEWQGTTYSGHGQDNLTLDLNRTSLVWPDPLHDLGQPILAQGDGVVVHVAQDGWNGGAGTYLEVDYGDVTAVYVHLVENSIAVEPGEVVSTGRLLGLLGNSGNIFSSTADKLAHLHLAYWDSSGAENARAYQLSTQIPVRIDGVDYVATASPRTPSAPFVSTNCDGATPPGSVSAPTSPHPFTDVATGSFAHDDIAMLYDLGITTGTAADRYSPAASVTREQMAAFLARLHRVLTPEVVDPATQSETGSVGSDDPGEPRFDDVPSSSFAFDDIHLIRRLGITRGTSDTTYSPADPVTREQMAAFLARLARLLLPGLEELPEPDPVPFTDVAPDSFAAADVALIHALGITTGTSPTSYSPDDVVTREQMAAFLARLHRVVELYT